MSRFPKVPGAGPKSVHNPVYWVRRHLQDSKYRAGRGRRDQISSNADKSAKEFNERWYRLIDVENSIIYIYARRLEDHISGNQLKKLHGLQENMQSLRQFIENDIEAASLNDLNKYTTSIKRFALESLKLAREYEIYDNIDTLTYNSKDKSIAINNKAIYFLGNIDNSANAGLDEGKSLIPLGSDIEHVLKANILLDDDISTEDVISTITRLSTIEENIKIDYMTSLNDVIDDLDDDVHEKIHYYNDRFAKVYEKVKSVLSHVIDATYVDTDNSEILTKRIAKDIEIFSNFSTTLKNLTCLALLAWNKHVYDNNLKSLSFSESDKTVINMSDDISPEDQKYILSTAKAIGFVRIENNIAIYFG